MEPRPKLETTREDYWHAHGASESRAVHACAKKAQKYITICAAMPGLYARIRSQQPKLTTLADACSGMP